MESKKVILQHLKKNEAENANIISFIESYPIHHMEIIGDSVLVKGSSDRKWIYISSKSEDELNTIKNKLNDSDKCFAIIEEWMIPILTKGSRMKWKLTTMKLVLDSKITLPGPVHDISGLKIEDSEFIYNNSDYKDYLSIDYINERIQNGISSCIRVIDKPVAWAITQDDGAIGFLHVLPEYRKNGYGRDITLDMISKLRQAGKIPFVHIEEKNVKSMNLAKSLGFKEERIVNWFEIE